MSPVLLISNCGLGKGRIKKLIIVDSSAHFDLRFPSPYNFQDLYKRSPSLLTTWFLLPEKDNNLGQQKITKKIPAVPFFHCLTLFPSCIFNCLELSKKTAWEWMKTMNKTCWASLRCGWMWTYIFCHQCFFYSFLSTPSKGNAIGLSRQSWNKSPDLYDCSPALLHHEIPVEMWKKWVNTYWQQGWHTCIYYIKSKSPRDNGGLIFSFIFMSHRGGDGAWEWGGGIPEIWTSFACWVCGLGLVWPFGTSVTDTL